MLITNYWAFDLQFYR